MGAISVTHEEGWNAAPVKALTVSGPVGTPAAVTTVSDSQGVLAQLTTGARSVVMRGPTRTFREDKKPFKDDFNRTTGPQFGKSPGGGNYSNTTGADAIFTVTGGTAKIALDVANSSRYTTLINDTADVEAVTRFTMDEIPVGNAASFGLVIGYADPNNNYRARLSILTSGTVQLTLEKEVAGVTTVLGALTTVGTGWVANQYWLIRIQRIGTQIRCRAWLDGTTEPTTWLHTATDSSLGAGRIGFRALASSGNTNVPFNYLIDYLDVVMCTWPNPISITHNSWVRLLDAPFDGVYTTAIENQIRAWDGSTVPDTLAYAQMYQAYALPVLRPDGKKLMGVTGYGPMNADGTLQEGADFHEFMGVGWTFPSGETAPAAGASWEGKLDCSGFVRMVLGYWMGIPMSVSVMDGHYLPRVSHDISDSGPGAIIAAAAGTVPSMAAMLPGDIVAFDADDDETAVNQIDHVGFFMGFDSLGVPRFVSSRKTPDGPTFADLGGSSKLTGTGLYATRLRKIRRP